MTSLRKAADSPGCGLRGGEVAERNRPRRQPASPPSPEETPRRPPWPVAWNPNRESHVIFPTPGVCSTSLVRFHLLHGVSSLAEGTARMETDETFETFFPPPWRRPSPLRSAFGAPTGRKKRSDQGYIPSPASMGLAVSPLILF